MLSLGPKAPDRHRQLQRQLLHLGKLIRNPALPTRVITHKTKSSQPESGSGQENRTSISSPAEMTGSPTSVSPGLAPTAISWGHPHLEIYALTNNNTNSIYRKYRNANATGEGEFEPEGYDMELIGSNIDASSAPSIAVNERRENPTTNQTEVFINAEGSCYNNWHIDNQLWIWWGPCFLGLSVVGAPVVVKYNASVTLVQVFSLGAADTRLAVYYTRWRARQDEYSDPAQIPGPDLQDMKPAVVAWNGDDTRVDIFVVARADNHLLHAWWSAGSWSEYEDLQGFVTTPPVVASRAPGILDVFIRGGDAGLWHISYNGTWTGWTRISSDSRIRGQPDAVAATRSIVDVFAWREDGCLLHKSFDGNSGRWTPEHDFEVLASGELISSPPNVVSDGEGSIHVFAYRNQDELIWIRLNSGSVGEGTYMTTLASVPYL